MMERTGADGVMIARYALENPFIFSELTRTPCTRTILDILLAQMKLTSTYYDESFTLVYMRKLISYAMKKRKGTKQYKAQLYRTGNLKELRELLLTIFS